MTRDVIIIGGGPAALTAALYASRANLKPLIFEGKESGGQLTTTTLVENYPGFPEGVHGPELVRLMREQAARFGVEFTREDVERVELKDHPFQVFAGGKGFKTRALIVATGAKARKLGLPSEQRLWGKGVSTCATCDGFFFKDKEIAVVGGGDAALEEALFLSRLVKKITVIHRRDKLRASKIMQERVLTNSKINFQWNTVVEEILGKERVESLRLRNTIENRTFELPLSGIFLAIGHEPATQIFQSQIELDQKGYIKVFDGTTKTSLRGVFACGDAVDFRYRQAITAAGTGCMAALDAERFLLEKF